MTSVETSTELHRPAAESSAGLSSVDAVRYATTLGTNALIERNGPRVGLVTTAGYESSVPLMRARGYGDGLDHAGQTDLPGGQKSGLNDAIDTLKDVDGVRFVRLTSKDVVRHDLVTRIVEAYDARDKKTKG